jgi:hypothetical protein
VSCVVVWTTVWPHLAGCNRQRAEEGRAGCQNLAVDVDQRGGEGFCWHEVDEDESVGWVGFQKGGVAVKKSKTHIFIIDFIKKDSKFSEPIVDVCCICLKYHFLPFLAGMGKIWGFSVLNLLILYMYSIF